MEEVRIPEDSVMALEETSFCGRSVVMSATTLGGFFRMMTGKYKLYVRSCKFYIFRDGDIVVEELESVFFN